MLRSREEIIKQCGELIDMVGELFDEKIKYERKFCEESRKRKEAETELAKSNFKLEKIKAYIKKGKEDNYNIDVNDILDIMEEE